MKYCAANGFTAPFDGIEQKNIIFFEKTLDKQGIMLYNNIVVGVWRRLVARYLGVVEAVGSSPVTPTRYKTSQLAENAF